MGRVALVCLVMGCGNDPGGGDGGGGTGEPVSAAFIFSGDRDGDTVLQGQVSTPGSVRLIEAPSGCVIPAPPADEAVSLAEFLPVGDEALRDIGDIALDGFAGLVIARTIDDTNLNYRLIDEHIPYPAAGTEVSVRAGRAYGDAFDASLIIGESPVVTAPADGSPFLRTEDLPMTIEAPGASGLVVDMNFVNGARALCFFDHDGDIVFEREAIAEDTFGITGSTDVLVGSWTIGEGGTDGTDVHLVSISTTAITLQLQ